MNENTRLRELVNLERRTQRGPERTEQGWQHLVSAVARGGSSLPEFSASKTLPLAHAWHASVLVHVCAVGGLVVAGVGGLWIESKRAPVIEAAPIMNHTTAALTVKAGQLSNNSPASEEETAAIASKPGEPDREINLPIGGSAPSDRSGVSTPRMGASGASGAAFASSVTFEKELVLIKAAKLALDAGHLQAALTLVNQHARLYPRGIFSGEREALRLLGTCGTLGAAQRSKLVDAFVRAYPNSPHVDRVLRVCSRESAKMGQ
jgi:hypothetical protein